MSNIPRSFLTGLALGGLPAWSVAAVAGSKPAATGGAIWWSLPLMLLLAIGAHVLLGRSLKAVVAASRPLAGDLPEVGGYERLVYGTADRAMRDIVLMVLGAGLLFWLAMLLTMPWVASLGILLLIGALALDLRRWERVTVSSDALWFQRGLGQKVHQVPIDNIRDITVTEADAPGFTLRHGLGNSLCRLNLRLQDKRIVALPKTDARGGLDAVETVANHIRTRQQLVNDRQQARNKPSASQFDSPDTVPASRVRYLPTRS